MNVATKSVRFEVSIWRDANNSIHIAAADPEIKQIAPNFHSTVNNRDGSVRCHKNLYGKLEAVLDACGV